MRKTAREFLGEVIEHHNKNVSDVYKFQFSKEEYKLFVDMMNEYAKQEISYRTPVCMKEVGLYSDDLVSEIKSLTDTNEIYENGILIPESDYGFAEIYRLHDDILVFTIPQYGGEPSFYKSYGLHAIETLVRDLRAIT